MKAILDALPAFLRHVYVKRCQEVAYPQEIEESSATKCVVQIQFAGNYTCVFQEEVQSAHWNNKQLTVFIACVWKGAKHNIVCSRCRHYRPRYIAREVLLAAEIEGSTQRHDPHAT